MASGQQLEIHHALRLGAGSSKPALHCFGQDRVPEAPHRDVTIEVLAPDRSHCLRQSFRRDMKHPRKRGPSIKDQKDGAGDRGRAQQQTNKRGDVAGHEQAVGAKQN
jgi:hypothetical protein